MTSWNFKYIYYPVPPFSIGLSFSPPMRVTPQDRWRSPWRGPSKSKSKLVTVTVTDRLGRQKSTAASSCQKSQNSAPSHTRAPKSTVPSVQVSQVSQVDGMDPRSRYHSPREHNFSCTASRTPARHARACHCRSNACEFFAFKCSPLGTRN